MMRVQPGWRHFAAASPTTWGEGAGPPKPTLSGLFPEGKALTTVPPRRNGKRPGRGSARVSDGASVPCPSGRCSHTLLPPCASKQPGRRVRAT
jgi:hypothetical protein